MSYKELQEQVLELQEKAKQARQEEVNALAAYIRGKMEEYNLSLDELNLLLNPSSSACYRCPKTGAIWNGRGRRPQWLKNALKQGLSLDDLRVK